MFALALFVALASPAPAVATAPATPPDGSYTYVSSMAGETIGTTTLTLKHTPQGASIAESGSASLMGQSGRFSDTLALGADLAPLSYQVQGALGPRAFAASITLSGTTASQTGTVAQSYTLAPGQAHFAVLDLGPFAGYFMLPAQEALWKNAAALAIAPAVGRAFAIVPDPTAAAPAHPTGVPAADAVLSYSSPVQISIWYDPKSLLVDEVDIPMQEATIKRVPAQPANNQ